jgi:uridine kinase
MYSSLPLGEMPFRAERVLRLPSPHTTFAKISSLDSVYIIGIAGGSASGKTYLLHSLRRLFTPEQVCIISQDNYYHPVEKQTLDEKGFINFDLPEAIDTTEFAADLERLKSGLAVQRREYMFNQPGVVGKMLTLEPAPVIVIEGIFTFHFPEIFERLDLKVFLDCKDEIMLQRRLERDIKERAVTEEISLYQWHHHVIPAYNSYLRPYRDNADIILTNNKGFGKGLEIMADHIKAILSGGPGLSSK